METPSAHQHPAGMMSMSNVGWYVAIYKKRQEFSCLFLMDGYCLLEQPSKTHVKVVALVGDALESVAIEKTVVVTKADAELIAVVESYTTADENVEILVVAVISVEADSARGGAADAGETAVKLVSRRKTIAERGASVDAQAEVFGKV